MAGKANANGVIVVDSFGLTIEKQGDFESAHSGLISSIMKNVGKLSVILASSQE